MSGDKFMMADDVDVDGEEELTLPLPGTPQQMFAADADEARAMDAVDAARSLKDAKSSEKAKQDPFGDAAKAMAKAAAEAQAVTDAETAARNAKRENKKVKKGKKAKKQKKDDDGDDKDALRRAL